MPYEYTSKDETVKLIPVRHYDPVTYKEKLKIKIEVNDDDHGEVTCSMLNLEKDLQQLREHGTGFSRSDIVDIRKKIENNIKEIERVEDETPSNPLDKHFENILKMYDGYIEDYKNEITFDEKDGLCHIPVKDFSEYLATSDFRICDEYQLRERLRDKNYIKANKGRTSNNVRVEKGTKPIKCISFYVDNERKITPQNKL